MNVLLLDSDFNLKLQKEVWHHCRLKNYRSNKFLRNLKYSYEMIKIVIFMTFFK